MARMRELCHTGSVQIRIAQPHTSSYPDPIEFPVGGAVQVEREDAEFPGWYWCRVESGKEGWVHRSYLAETTPGETVAVRDYSARELTVAGGETGDLVESLDGWILVRLESGEVGWVPEGTIEKR